MEYGESLGLAQDFQSAERINDLRYRQHALKAAQNEAEAKSAMLANDLQYNNVMNQHDYGIVKENAKNQIYKIGKFRRENPDWSYNVEKRAQYNNMVRELKDNPDLLRGMASDGAYKSYVTDMQEVAKNPEAYDTDAYNSIGQQWKNYLQYGNQNGYEAAQKDGKMAFVYNKPKNFVNLPKALMDLGAGIQNYDVQKGKNIGEWWTTPNPNDVKAIKNSAYQEHARQIAVEAQKAGITDPKAVDDWVSSQIAAGFKKHYSIGDPNALFNRQIALAHLGLARQKAAGKSQGIPFSSYDEIFKVPAGYINQEAARKTWGDNPPIYLQGTSGKKVDLTGHDFHYDGRSVSANGDKFVTGFVKLPKEIAEQQGIYKQGWFTVDGITSDFEGQASVEQGVDKDGKAIDYVKVKYALPIDPNDKKARVLFDTFSQPDKTVDIPNPTQNMPETVLQGGFEYHYNQQTGKYE